jgi:hypothetical protein
MANLATTDVTVIRKWTVPSTSFLNSGEFGKDLMYVQATFTATTMGSLTNKLLATAFGLTTIVGCSNGVDSAASLLYIAAPSYDGTMIVIGDVVNATDGTRSAPVDISKTLRITVWGFK